MPKSEGLALRSKRARYGFALISVAIAAAWMAVWQWFGLEPVVAPFLLAILATGWYAGGGPVLLATILSATSYVALNAPPAAFAGWQLAPHLAWFLVFAGATAWFSAARRRIAERLEKSRDGLEETVLARTAELRRSEEILLAAQRMSHTGNWSWNVVTGEVHWSDECRRILDRDLANMTRARMREIWHPDDREGSELAWDNALRGKQPYDRFVRMVRPNGDVRYVHGAGRPVFNDAGDVVEYIGVMMDVTDLKDAEDQAMLAKEEASEARFEAKLDERARLARELHDTLLQGFTGVGLKLVAVANRMTGPPETVAALREVIASAQMTLENARRAIWDIRPPSNCEDFVPALRAAAEEGVRGTSLALDFSVQGTPLPTNPDIETTVFRVLQEAVANVVKHAAARTVRVELSYEAKAIRLRVADDGQGFDADPNFRSYGGHLGVLGMRERAARLNGTLEIVSSRGKGTEVLLNVPCPRFADAHPNAVSAGAPQ